MLTRSSPRSVFHDDVENGDGDVVVVPDQFECFLPGMRMQEVEQATVDADVLHREDSRVERRIVVDDQDVPGFSAREFLVLDAVRGSSKMCRLSSDGSLVIAVAEGVVGSVVGAVEHWVLSGAF